MSRGTIFVHTTGADLDCATCERKAAILFDCEQMCFKHFHKRQRKCDLSELKEKHGECDICDDSYQGYLSDYLLWVCETHMERAKKELEDFVKSENEEDEDEDDEPA